MNKKIYFGLVLLLVTITSCDPAVFHDFYIENCCEETIEITVFYDESYAYPAYGRRPLTTIFVIEPNNYKMIGAESTIGPLDKMHN